MTAALGLEFAPVCAMAAVQQTPQCAFGCALPMQPIPDAPDVWRCSNCGSLGARDGDALLLDTMDARVELRPADAIAEAVAALHTAIDILAAYAYIPDDFARLERAIVTAADAIQVEAAVRAAITRLTSAPMIAHGDAVHAIAIEAAARTCEGRARSLFHESGNATASLEANKCAAAVRRIATRTALAARPELIAPKEGRQ